MNCRDVQGLAGNYLDGELPEEMCDRVQRHLLRCAACRDEVETQRMAVQVLAQTHTTPVVGEAFIQEALARLARELDIPSPTADAPGQLVLGIREEH